MKINLFASLMIGALVCSCSSKEDFETPNTTTEQMASNGNVCINFSTSAVSATLFTRSAEESDSTEQGSENEWKLDKVRIYVFNSDTKKFNATFLLDSLTRTVSAETNGIVYKSKNFHLDNGTYDFFAVANTDDVLTAQNEDEFINNIDNETYKMGLIPETTSGIVMSNRASANLGEVIVNSDKNRVENFIDINLERVVARIDVGRNADSYALTDTLGNTYATVSLGDFHLVNLPTCYYTFRHIATLTSLTVPTWDINTNFGAIPETDGYVIDPYFFSKNVDASAFTNKDGYYVNFYPEYYKGDNVTWTNFKAAGTANYNTCYSLENCTMQDAQKNGYSTGVVFRGELQPNNNVYCLNDAGDLELLPSTSKASTLYYYGYKFYNSIAALSKAGVKISESMTDEELMHAKVYRFQLTNGKYYTYYDYWIRHLDNNNPSLMGVMEFGIVRNNLYRLFVTNIAGLGFGNIPPKPNRPDEGSSLVEVYINVQPWIIRDQTNIVL